MRAKLQQTMIQWQPAWELRATAGLISTNTLAAGDRARALLDEMLRGRSLIFRAAAADPGLGPPTGGSQSAGIIQGGQQIPIPLCHSGKNRDERWPRRTQLTSRSHPKRRPAHGGLMRWNGQLIDYRHDALPNCKGHVTV